MVELQGWQVVCRTLIAFTSTRKIPTWFLYNHLSSKGTEQFNRGAIDRLLKRLDVPRGPVKILSTVD